MRTGKGKAVERMLKKLQEDNVHNWQPLIDAFDKMQELLDEAEKFWNTPGWRERIGWEK